MSVPAFAPSAPASLPAPGSLPAPTFGGLPDLDPPPAARTRWYLIAAAIVLAFALGAVVTHLMRSSAGDKPTPTSGAGRSSVAPNPFVPEGTARAEALSAPERGGAPAGGGTSRSPPPMLTSQAVPVEPTGSSSFDTATSSLRATPPTRAALAFVDGENRAERSREMGAPGLDAVTVRRTVRRYSPAVRRSCWHGPFGARAPGVPSSAKVTASITVEPTGRVHAVSVSGAPMGYPGLTRCIEGIVLGWRFPRARARTITSVPFVFVGG